MRKIALTSRVRFNEDEHRALCCPEEWQWQPGSSLPRGSEVGWLKNYVGDMGVKIAATALG